MPIPASVTAMIANDVTSNSRKRGWAIDSASKSSIKLLLVTGRRSSRIRIALGASPQGLVRSVLADGARLVSISIAVGLVGSLALTRSVRGLLFGVSPTDLWTYAVVSAVLFGVAILACYLPARRASGADPVMVLRAD